MLKIVQCKPHILDPIVKVWKDAAIDVKLFVCSSAIRVSDPILLPYILAVSKIPLLVRILPALSVMGATWMHPKSLKPTPPSFRG